MGKEYIKLNDNDNHLSLGNLFRIIKEESVMKNSFLQSDLFCILFDISDISDSTVNNYCTGYRSINTIYKEAFLRQLQQYSKKPTIFVDTILKIVDILEDFVHTNTKAIDDKLTLINTNSKLRHVCFHLYSLSKNDTSVDPAFSKDLKQQFDQKDYYSFLILILDFVILKKKQPVFVEDEVAKLIESNIYHTNISVHEITDFMNVQLQSGILSIRNIMELAKQENPFACFEMGSLEFYGWITGKPNYFKSYQYYTIAAKKQHPVANWAIGFLYYHGYIGSKSHFDLRQALHYLNLARKLNCSYAFNSLGQLYLSGTFSHVAKDEKKAITLFEIATKQNNVYAYNNLGLYYEKKADYEKAFSYYLKSADLGESWAANRIGEYYRKGIYVTRDLEKAFSYYTISSESPAYCVCAWSFYNLATYFYKTGCLELGIQPDIEKAIMYYQCSSDTILESNKELVLIYYERYLSSGKKETYWLEQANLFLKKLQNHPVYTKQIGMEFESILQKQYDSYEFSLKE